ncbi:hypothetical protein CRENBAI_016712 [Crenichthys baileyi]|uniref:Uncharacterized protein n=1 Tax=Crenichthys baileyi TaxID=28760 RepID=A0AAV9RD97_9TELE
MNRLHTLILFLVQFRGGSWMNRLHTPILFLVLFRRGPKPSRPHTLFLSVRGSWMDCLHFLLLFPVLSWRAPRTNCLHSWFPFRRSLWRTCLPFLFLSLRSARTQPLCMLCHGGSAADLYGLTEGPSGLRTAPLSSTVGSPGPATGRQIIGSYVADLLITCPYVAGLLIARSAQDGLSTASVASSELQELPERTAAALLGNRTGRSAHYIWIITNSPPASDASFSLAALNAALDMPLSLL